MKDSQHHKIIISERDEELQALRERVFYLESLLKEAEKWLFATVRLPKEDWVDFVDRFLKELYEERR